MRNSSYQRRGAATGVCKVGCTVGTSPPCRNGDILQGQYLKMMKRVMR